MSDEMGSYDEYMRQKDAEPVAQETSPQGLPWSWETMQMVNRLTPHISGKAFDPGWFVLRNRLEEFERAYLKLAEENAAPSAQELAARDLEWRTAMNAEDLKWDGNIENVVRWFAGSCTHNHARELLEARKQTADWLLDHLPGRPPQCVTDFVADIERQLEGLRLRTQPERVRPATSGAP